MWIDRLSPFVINDYVDVYLEGHWDAPPATVAYYRTDSRGVVYMACISLEQYGTGERLYSCKGSGIGGSEGYWPQNSSEIDCESPYDPVDCGSGPITWDPDTGVWEHGAP